MTRRILALCALLLAATCAVASDHGAPYEVTIPRMDGSELKLLIEKPEGHEAVPILLVIDGSLCIPSRIDSQTNALASSDGTVPYATIVVEKPGVLPPPVDEDGEIRIGPGFSCTETFKKYYTIDQRMFDHLRAIQYLRRHADWWNGELLIWGFSDGGRIASRVGAFTPETKGMVLGGFGGGRAMSVDFEEFHICNPVRTADVDSCLAELRGRFEEMRTNPTHARSWNGDANTWATWASRLDAVEAHLLADVSFPVLMFHGTEDSSTPVDSARLLAQRLQSNPGFTYREIGDMGHGLGSGLPDGEGEALRKEFLSWLTRSLSSDADRPFVD